MSDKISMKAVAVDALRLMRLRARVYLGGAMAGVLIVLPLMLSYVFNDYSLELTLAGWGAILLLCPLLYMVVFHDSLMALRGTPKILPDRFVRRYLLVLWKFFLLTIMVFGVAELCAVVLGVFIFMRGDAARDISDVFIPVSMVVMSVSSYLLVRWGMALPAVSAGDAAGFRRSWRMTRGHVLRMLLCVLPYAVLVGVSVVANIGAIRDRTFDPFSPAYLLYMVVGTALFWVTFAAFTIWYERLRMNYESTLNSELSGDAGEASMSKKISPVAVVKQAVALSWSRKWTFAGLLLAGMAPIAVGMGTTVVSGTLAGPVFVLMFCLHTLGMLFLMTTSNHLAVTMQRGPGSVFPRRFWPAMGRVFVRGLILMALSLAVMLVFMVPAGALLYVYFPQGDAVSIWPMVLSLLLFVAAYVLVVALMLRLGIMLPGAAAGAVVRVREALAMTRGHSWRMFGSMMLIALPVMILGGMFQAFIAFSTPSDPFSLSLIIPGLLLLALDLFSWIVMLVMNAVWYEKLRLRAADPGAGSGPDFEVAPASSPDPRAGSGVGPYADLPEDE